ncbi:TolC family protein [Nitratifractor sp.]
MLGAGTLSLKRCVDLAVTTHPDVKSYLLQVSSEEQGVRMSRSARLPQVNVHASYHPTQTFVMPVMGTFHTQDESAWNAGVTLSQLLFDFGRSGHNVAASQIRHRIASLSLEEAKALMRYRVRVAYAQLLAQGEAVKARQKDLAAKRANLEQAKALVRQGLKTRADESRFLSAWYGARDALALAQAAYEKARIALEQYIGRPIPPGTRFEKGVLYRGKIPGKKEERVLRDNLTLKIASENIRASQERYRATKLERFGSVELSADYEANDNLSRYNTFTAGVQYSAPIFSGGRHSAQSQQSRIATMIAAEELDSKKRAILQEYRSLRADLKEIRTRIAARRAQERSSLETMKLIEARYAQGLATYMEVLDAEAMWLEARFGLIDAYYARAATIFRLEYLDGK